MLRLDDEIDGALEIPECGSQIDDVNAVSLAEDERFHLGIPAPCLMPEMDTGVQQLLDGNGAHLFLPVYLLENWNRLRAPGCPYFFRSLTR